MHLEFLNLSSVDPCLNLACEQFVFDRLPRDRSYVLLWQNDNALVIGKYQNAYAQVNLSYVQEHGIQVVRRLSGGGAVYHDLGNLNYTFITDAGNPEQLNLKLFCRPVLKVLQRLGVEAELSGRNDITLAGRKISGNSQYIKQGRVLHHGTLLFDSDLSVLEQALRVDPEKIRAKGIASVRSRVTNIREHLQDSSFRLVQFRRLLLEEMTAGAAAEHVLLPEELDDIMVLRERYASWEWTWGQSRACTLTRSHRFPGCGEIELDLTLDNGILTDVRFRGDFFSVREPSLLADLLIGRKYPLEDDLPELTDAIVSQSFVGLTRGQFLCLLTGT